MSPVSVCVCLCLCLFVFVPVHVEGGLGIGFTLPIPRWPQIETPFPAGGVCAFSKLGAPKSTLYYGRNQIVVRFREFTANNYLQLKLYGYVPSNQTTPSTAGPYNGMNWSYESDSSARVLATTIYNATAPVGLPQGEIVWDQVAEIDIPQGITCTPHCTLQLVGTTVSPAGALVSAVSCSDVVLIERRPTSVYMTLRPDGCCPLESVTVARRLYELQVSGGVSPFSLSATSLWSYQSEMTTIVSNVWKIDHTAPNTFKINPQTGYYSVKLIIHDQHNLTAQQFITTITNTQLVSSALAPDSRGANNSYVWWGDAPNTYVPGGNGKSMNAATASLSLSSSISIFTVATALIAYIIANAAHI